MTYYATRISQHVPYTSSDFFVKQREGPPSNDGVDAGTDTVVCPC